MLFDPLDELPRNSPYGSSYSIKRYSVIALFCTRIFRRLTVKYEDHISMVTSVVQE